MRSKEDKEESEIHGWKYINGFGENCLEIFAQNNYKQGETFLFEVLKALHISLGMIARKYIKGETFGLYLIR